MHFDSSKRSAPVATGCPGKDKYPGSVKPWIKPGKGRSPETGKSPTKNNGPYNSPANNSIRVISPPNNRSNTEDYLNIVSRMARMLSSFLSFVFDPIPVRNNRRCHLALRTMFALLCIGYASGAGLSGCVGPLNQRVMYESKGTLVGFESDHTIDDKAVPPALNSHPAQFTAEELRTLLGSLEVSGWSGIIIGVFETPHAKPVFTGTELMSLADTFAKAFQEVGPRERVFFSLQNPNARYETDRTAGSLFLRDGYLHIILQDHYSYLKADPGGGEQRDPRDTKGMKLWTVRPAQPATVPEEKEPRWSAFDKVHISLLVRDVLAAFKGNPAPIQPQTAPVQADADQRSPSAKTTETPPSNREKDLTQQVQDLDSSNQQLRMQVEQQTKELDTLKEDLRRLRDDLKAQKNAKPSLDRKPSRKPPSE